MPPVGGLTELPGTLGCISYNGSSEAGASSCQVGRGLAHAESVTLSPDGRFAYVGGYSGSTPSTTPPPTLKLTNVTQSHRTWRESNALATIASGPKPPIATTFSFTLNKTARVTFAFTQKKNAHSKSITRGTITFTGHAGRNKVAFGGRVNRHNRLAGGTYTVIITAGKAPARRLTFTIVT